MLKTTIIVKSPFRDKEYHVDLAKVK